MRHSRLSEEEISRIKELRAQEISRARIATEMGIGVTTVQRYTDPKFETRRKNREERERRILIQATKEKIRFCELGLYGNGGNGEKLEWLTHYYDNRPLDSNSFYLRLCPDCYKIFKRTEGNYSSDQGKACRLAEKKAKTWGDNERGYLVNQFTWGTVNWPLPYGDFRDLRSHKEYLQFLEKGGLDPSRLEEVRRRLYKLESKDQERK